MTEWHDPLSTPPDVTWAAEHVGDGRKLWMRGSNGELRHPTRRELEQHGYRGNAPVDVEQREDDYARWRLQVSDDFDGDGSVWRSLDEWASRKPPPDESEEK
jgi:hypothetical protein